MARRAVRRRASTFSAILVNPSSKYRRRKSKARKANPKRRRTSARRSRRNPKRRRTSARRSRRSNPKRRRTTRRRRNASSKSSAHPVGIKRHYRAKPHRKSNPRRSRRSRRAAPRVAYRRRSNPKHRRSRRKGYARRRNPAFVQGLAAKVAGIPFIGGPLSKLVSFLPHAGIGVLGTELTLRLAPTFGAMEVPSWLQWLKKPLWYFSAIGAGLGIAAAYFVPGSPETKKRIAIAFASAGAGAGWALARTGVADVAQIPAAESLASPFSGIGAYGAVGIDTYGAVGIDTYGAIGMDGFGMAPAYTVSPGYGAVMMGG